MGLSNAVAVRHCGDGLKIPHPQNRRVRHPGMSCGRRLRIEGVESKSRVLGSERGYRVATEKLRQDAMVGRGKPRPYKWANSRHCADMGRSGLRPYKIEMTDKLGWRRMRVERV